jgi:hypothetical protein
MHAHVRENFFVAQIFMRGVGRLLRDNFQQTEAKATLERLQLKV